MSVVEATQPMIFCCGRQIRLKQSPWKGMPNYDRRTIPFSTYTNKYDWAKITPWRFLENPDFQHIARDIKYTNSQMGKKFKFLYFL